MKRNLWAALLAAGSVLAATASPAAEYFLSPTGNDSATGAIDAPWADLAVAIPRLAPGDTLWLRGGQYDYDDRVRIRSSSSGQPGAPVRVWAYGGETPVLDFSGNPASLGSSQSRGVALDDNANHFHFRGLTIQNARDNGLYAEGDHNVFEQLTLRWNADSGLQLSGDASGNRILNTDSYENFDPHNSGENADGFAAKFDELGPGNVFDGARAWGNSDDGWDLWEAASGVEVRNSWAFDNGYNLWNSPRFDGDGNGLKLGQNSGDHLLTGLLVWGNAVRGIDVNGNGTGVEVYNSTVWDSGRNWQFDEESFETTNQHVLQNNVSFDGGSSDQFDSGVDDSSNTWNGPRLSAADFLSLDDTIARGPRRPDGSLPISDFLRPAPGGLLADAGAGVGLPFLGPAPDLGAFENTDYNADGVVDAADYVVWRNTPGGAHAPSDLLAWRATYGAAAPGGSPVPEPTAAALLLLAAAGATRRPK